MSFVQKVKNIIHFFESWVLTFLYGFPIKKIKPIFVTGSDGKTTTSYFIYNILNSCGKKTALMSTVEAKVGGKDIDTGLHTTTPSRITLQKILKEIAKEKCDYVVFEVTSHGIDQHRIVGAKPIASVFTNITKEHLDYFKTYEKLIETKAKIIPIAKKAYINKHAFVSDKLVKIANDSNTEYVEYDRELIRPKLSSKFTDKFPGDYNFENAAAAYYLTKDLGINEDCIIKALEESTPPVGRFVYVENDKPFDIVIDFAHTSQAIKEVLKAVRDRVKGRIIVVFGSAGERDVQKRPAMGEAAGKYADITVLTAEDPRSEKVEDICEQISVGIEKEGGIRGETYFVKPDRKDAIEFAINSLAKEGDMVIITGKGHERSMNFDGIEYPWSDQKAVEEVLGR